MKAALLELYASLIRLKFLTMQIP